MTTEDIRKLFDRYKNIENEINVLKEDKAVLMDEFKKSLSPKAFKAALAAVKTRAKLKPNESDDYDQIYEFLEKEISIDFID
jgi:hypothetical protein